MTIGVCFSNESKRSLQDQWSWVFSNFDVTDIWERGPKGADLKIYQETTPIETAAELPADRPLVVLAPPEGRFVKGTETLYDFEHPDDAIYLFGGSHAVLTLDDLGGREPEHAVFIETRMLEMYAFSAAYITLYDRMAKAWRIK